MTLITKSWPYGSTFSNLQGLMDTFNSRVSNILNETIKNIDVTEGFGIGLKTQHSYPKVEIQKTDEGIKLVAHVAGIAKENLTIDSKIEDDQIYVTISGEKVDVGENTQILYSELRRSAFTRVFTFPKEKYILEDIAAKLDDGVLVVTVPYMGKPEEEIPKVKTIEIK